MITYNPVTREYLRDGVLAATDADIANAGGPRQMPAQKPGSSKQDYATPRIFLAAVKAWLGVRDFDIDLAASAENAVTAPYYDEAQNSLVQPWKVGRGWNWLNPPFARIEPWVQRAWTQLNEAGAQTAVLIPAGVGANWWRDWVHRKAHVLLLNGRLAFMPDKPTWLYPKDTALLLYGMQTRPEYDVWTWRQDVPTTEVKAA